MRAYSQHPACERWVEEVLALWMMCVYPASSLLEHVLRACMFRGSSVSVCTGCPCMCGTVATCLVSGHVRAAVVRWSWASRVLATQQAMYVTCFRGLLGVTGQLCRLAFVSVRAVACGARLPGRDGGPTHATNPIKATRHAQPAPSRCVQILDSRMSL